jgi:hypothetical protein
MDEKLHPSSARYYRRERVYRTGFEHKLMNCVKVINGGQRSESFVTRPVLPTTLRLWSSSASTGQKSDVARLKSVCMFVTVRREA